MNQSTMFLENITVVDHAYIDQEGKVIGGSKHASFLVTGNIDPVENVVVDFSTIKHDLKGWVDDKEEGFDHKLWLIQGYSQYTKEDLGNNLIKITTPAMEAILPKNAVKEFEGTYAQYSLERVYNQYLESKMPGLTIKTELTEIVFDRGVSTKFRYSHGLKNSTSWGCQNPCHGHLSFIQLADKDNNPITGYDINLYADLEVVSNNLHNTVFIWDDNVINETSTSITIKYETPERGLFVVTYDKSKNKIKVLNTETTVEFLADYITSEYNALFKNHKISYVWVSEGLSKGAISKVQ